jgi:hypothetical protein
VSSELSAERVAVLQAKATDLYEAWLDAQDVEQKALWAYRQAFSDVVQARMRAGRVDGSVTP